MKDEKETRVALVDKLRAEGRSLATAIKEAKTSRSSYYSVKAKKAPKPPKKKRFIDLPVVETAEIVTLIVCKPDQIASVLRGLK